MCTLLYYYIHYSDAWVNNFYDNECSTCWTSSISVTTINFVNRSIYIYCVFTSHIIASKFSTYRTRSTIFFEVLICVLKNPSPVNHTRKHFNCCHYTEKQTRRVIGKVDGVCKPHGKFAGCRHVRSKLQNHRARIC